jgi:hypothetical protein
VHEAYQFLRRRMRKSGGAPQSLGSRKSSVIGLVGLGGKEGNTLKNGELRKRSQSLGNIKEEKKQ